MPHRSPCGKTGWLQIWGYKSWGPSKQLSPLQRCYWTFYFDMLYLNVYEIFVFKHPKTHFFTDFFWFFLNISKTKGLSNMPLTDIKEKGFIIKIYFFKIFKNTTFWDICFWTFRYEKLTFDLWGKKLCNTSFER